MGQLKDLQNIILNYPKVKERVQDRKAEREKVLKIIDETRGGFSPNVVNSIQKGLELTFFRLYDGFSITLPEHMDLVNLSRENNLIIVPNHQSHADYVALTSIFFSRYKIPMMVAGGINLNIFPIGRLLRNAGCFFIRRSFGSDVLYKSTLEAYIYYLLLQGIPLEFFFEGGRSRTGKLLPPRYGMFQMIMEAHAHIDPSIRRPLKFLPVSLAHENLPEGGSHASELKGRKKSKENAGQLLKLYKLFNKKFGTIHVRLNPVVDYVEDDHGTQSQDLKKITQDIAFDCYRAVGRGMTVTPTAVLALALLGEYSGALTWDEIETKTGLMLSYCENFHVPLSQSLMEGKAQESLRRAMEILITNKKIKIIEKLGKVFYAIEEDSRVDLTYFKNTILHHFLVPFIINCAWVNMFKGVITDVASLHRFLAEQRDQLKYEFYLPTLKEMLRLALDIISYCVGKKMEGLEDCLHLTPKELYKIASKLGVFGRACSYIIEGYYIGASTLRHLGKKSSTLDEIHKASKEIFEMEKVHGRLIKFPESYSLPLIDTALKYFEKQQLIEKVQARYSIISHEKVERMIEKLAEDLTAQLTFKLKFESVATPASRV